MNPETQVLQISNKTLDLMTIRTRSKAKEQDIRISDNIFSIFNMIIECFNILIYTLLRHLNTHSQHLVLYICDFLFQKFMMLNFFSDLEQLLPIQDLQDQLEEICHLEHLFNYSC